MKNQITYDTFIDLCKTASAVEIELNNQTSLAKIDLNSLEGNELPRVIFDRGFSQTKQRPRFYQFLDILKRDNELMDMENGVVTADSFGEGDVKICFLFKTLH